MKKLSDYKDDEAIELWADLLEPLTSILQDKGVRNAVQSGKSNKLTIAKEILKSHKREASEILLRIDPEPIDGLNIIIRLVEVIVEIGQNETVKSFFGFAEQEKTEDESTGSAMETTEDEEN